MEWSMSKLKICLCCLYCHKSKTSHEFNLCKKKEKENYDVQLLVGNIEPELNLRYHYCKTHRETDWLSALIFNWCGHSGRFYERKL